MNTQEKRIAAYMNLHGYSRAEALAKIRENPAPRSAAPKAAKKRMSKKAYVNRPSQAGEQRAPSPRLKARRKANLDAPKGVYPNPVKSVSSKDMYVKTVNGKYRVYMNRPFKGWFEYDKTGQYIGESVSVRKADEKSEYNVDKLAEHADYVLKHTKPLPTFPKQNPLKPGITARARKSPTSSTRKMLSVDYSKSADGPWTIAGVFPNRQLAADYARTMADRNNTLYWRVATL